MIIKMNYNFKIEQARNGKIAVYSGPKNVILTLSQITGMGIDVYQLEEFDLVAFQKAYHLEDVANAGIPLLGRKRRDFFCDLLEEYQAQPSTPLRDANIQLLKEMDDELPKDWLSYENRPPQRFIGRISAVHGDAKRVSVKTSGGDHLWEVFDPALREFILHEYDIGRHQRYDWDINTDLVASVKDSTLVGLEWLVPWNEKEPFIWKLQNVKTLCCSCIVHETERIYMYVQANPCAHGYRYAEAFISLHRYSPEQIVQLLQESGLSTGLFRSANNSFAWQGVADALAQIELQNPKNEQKQLLTHEEVRQKIENETKLDLSEYRMTTN